MRNGSDDGSSGTESELWARLSIRRHDFAALEILLTSIEQNIERIDREIGTEEQVVRRSLIFVMSTAVFLGSVIVAPPEDGTQFLWYLVGGIVVCLTAYDQAEFEIRLDHLRQERNACAVGSGS
jgi:hypothetical protein